MLSYLLVLPSCGASQVALVVKNLPANAGQVRDVGSVTELGRSPGGGHGNPLQYSCWRIPWMEECGRLQSIGSQSQTQLKQLSTHEPPYYRLLF